MNPPFKMPSVIGHRGLAGLAPENTLPAFEAAAAHKLTFVELDAKLCASGEVIVLHDNRIDRTSNGHGRAGNMSLSALRRFDFGAWFDASFSGTSISTLSDVLVRCAQLNLGVNIELKPNPDQYALTARAVAQVISDGDFAAKLPLLMSSFSMQSLRAIKKYAPHLPRAVLLERQLDLTRALQLLREMEAVSCNVDAQLLQARHVEAIKSAGYAVMAWTVNDGEHAKQLRRLGVDSFFSDYPLTIT